VSSEQFLRGSTHGATGCRHRPLTRLIAADLTTPSTVLRQLLHASRVARSARMASIGPFATAPGHVVRDAAKIGTFVEVKTPNRGGDNGPASLLHRGRRRGRPAPNRGAGSHHRQLRGFETSPHDDLAQRPRGVDTSYVAPVRGRRRSVDEAGVGDHQRRSSRCPGRGPAELRATRGRIRERKKEGTDDPGVGAGARLGGVMSAVGARGRDAGTVCGGGGGAGAGGWV